MKAIQRLLKLTCFSGIILFASSCVLSKDPTSNNDPVYVNIGILLPNLNGTDLTKHGAPNGGSAEESKITSLTFFVFKGDNTFEQYKYVSINSDNSSSDALWDPVHSSMRLLLTPGAKKILVVANWSSGMPDGAGINVLTDVKGILVNRVASLPTTPLLMSGEMNVTLVGGESNLQVALTRQVAQVKVYPMISPSAAVFDANISIEGIQVMNIIPSSYLFSKSTNPTPFSPFWSQSSFSGGSSNRITATTKNEAQLYQSFYLPEFYGDANNHIYMAIKAKYNNMETYYFIPINGDAGSLPQPYTIERNHCYTYYLTIQGEGSSSPTRASAGSPYPVENDNLDYELVNE